ncbi:MAG: hypothetical protein O7G29_08940 [Acidobacteria bacterium]|nr:hypothetical protein [Acidobacteriota bacterium]
MGHRRRFRKLKFIDKQQQLRFAMELALYAILFPLFFLILSLADPIVNSLMGKHTEKILPLYSLLAFCTEHWWEFLLALGLVGWISILFSHRIVGPIRRFENALIQKTENPAEPVNCRLRSKDYFREFSQRLHEFLNAPQALAGSGDPEGSTQSRGPEIYEEDSEVSR